MYPGPDHTCPKWTDETLTLDYDFLYRLCKDYIKICDMYKSTEKLIKEHPDKAYQFNFHNEDFFLQCCLNDMKRELSLYELQK